MFNLEVMLVKIFYIDKVFCIKNGMLKKKDIES